MEYQDAIEESKTQHNELYVWATAVKLAVTAILAIDGEYMQTLRTIHRNFPQLPHTSIHLPNIQEKTYVELAKTGRCTTALMEVEAYLRTLTLDQLRLINSAYLDFCGSVWGCAALNCRPLECIHYLLTHCRQRVFVLATTFSVRSGPDGHASRGKDMYETIEQDMLAPCFHYSGYRICERYEHRYARVIGNTKGTNMVFYIHVLMRDTALDGAWIYFPRSKKRCNGKVVVDGWRDDVNRRFITDASVAPKHILRAHPV